jgi:hypothetical protein
MYYKIIKSGQDEYRRTKIKVETGLDHGKTAIKKTLTPGEKAKTRDQMIDLMLGHYINDDNPLEYDDSVAEELLPNIRARLQKSLQRNRERARENPEKRQTLSERIARIERALQHI